MPSLSKGCVPPWFPFSLQMLVSRVAMESGRGQWEQGKLRHKELDKVCDFLVAFTEKKTSEAHYSAFPNVIT